jgi:hypothetical protein
MPTTTTACCRPSNLKTFPADRVPRSLCEWGAAQQIHFCLSATPKFRGSTMQAGSKPRVSSSFSINQTVHLCRRSSCEFLHTGFALEYTFSMSERYKRRGSGIVLQISTRNCHFDI